MARNRIRKVDIVPIPREKGRVPRAEQEILDRLKRAEAEAAKKRKEKERKRKKSDGGKVARDDIKFGEGTIRRIKPSDVGRRAQFIKV